jgi:(p)ppGpp synthase/HD superfamily hydrolase
MIDEAIEFALKAHKGMFRKGTKTPYIFHPLEALTIAAKITTDEEILSASVLHDTVEDTDTTYEDIKKEFGQRVADIVNAESEDKTKTWDERKTYTLNTLKDESIEVKIVALADKLSNMRSIAKDYSELGDTLWQRFNVKDKNKQGWYYKGIVKALEELNNTYEWQELQRLTKKVFEQ